jgi:hypothetical protein
MLWILFITTALSRTLKMPATVYIEEPPPLTNLSRAEVLDALEKSTSEWEVISSTVDFKIVDNQKNADILISWTLSYHMPAYAWGYATVWPSSVDKEIGSALIELRSDCDWKDAEAVDFQSTLTHELGHTLGFSHSDYYDDTMYFSIEPGDTSKRSLTRRERALVRYMYPRSLFSCAGFAKVALACDDLECAEIMFESEQCYDDAIFEILYAPLE